MYEFGSDLLAVKQLSLMALKDHNDIQHWLKLKMFIIGPNLVALMIIRSSQEQNILGSMPGVVVVTSLLRSLCENEANFR